MPETTKKKERLVTRKTFRSTKLVNKALKLLGKLKVYDNDSQIIRAAIVYYLNAYHKGDLKHLPGGKDELLQQNKVSLERTRGLYKHKKRGNT